MKPFEATLLLLVAFLFLSVSQAASVDASGSSSVYGQSFFNVGIYHDYPTASITLYNQDGALWWVHANGSLTCNFTVYTSNETDNLNASVSWIVNGTNSTGNFSMVYNVSNGSSYIATLDSGNLSENEEWDCEVAITDSYGKGSESSSAEYYTIYVLGYGSPIAEPGSVHLAIYALFIIIALLCVCIDVFADIPYLGVFGGVMFILLGTVMAFDVPKVYRVFCDPGYNYTSIMCITRTVAVEPTMNTGISAMMWVIGLGILLEALYFGSNNIRREET